MQSPMEDTEWNDVLRAKGILPPKQKEVQITEEQIQSMIDETIKKRSEMHSENGRSSKNFEDMNLEELKELEDSEDEAVFEQYRRKRLEEISAFNLKAKFGCVREISGQDYVSEVTKAGESIWVVLHLYANGVRHCAVIHHYLQQLAVRYPKTKFLRSIATTCITNFPEKNVPTIFIYYEGQLRKQFIGSHELRGEKLSLEELEYMLGQSGAIDTDIREDPKSHIKDKLLSDLEKQNIEFY